MFYAGFLWWRNLFLPVILLWEIITCKARNKGLKESRSSVRYQEEKNIGEFKLFILLKTGPNVFVCFWSAHQCIFLQANCNMASLKTPLCHSLIYDDHPYHAAGPWRKVGRSWRWWWHGLASTAVAQPALSVYRTVEPCVLYPQPPSSFLIMLLKSCCNHSS